MSNGDRGSSHVAEPGVDKIDPAFLYLTRKLAAVEALAHGRLSEAHHIIGELIAAPAPSVRGVCRYCGCSEARACTILADFGGLEPVLARCGWADAEGTVCTSISCLERWRRESPAALDVDVHDVTEAAARTSRIVIP